MRLFWVLSVIGVLGVASIIVQKFIDLSNGRRTPRHLGAKRALSRRAVAQSGTYR